MVKNEAIFQEDNLEVNGENEKNALPWNLSNELLEENKISETDDEQ